MSSFEEVAQALVTCFEAEQGSRFAAGDVLVASGARGKELSSLGSTVGRSKSFLASLKQVSEAFPPDERAQDMAWSVHLWCARTSEPVVWLEYAIENQCSVRQLRQKLIEEGEVADKTKTKTCPNCGAEL